MPTAAAWAALAFEVASAAAVDTEAASPDTLSPASVATFAVASAAAVPSAAA